MKTARPTGTYTPPQSASNATTASLTVPYFALSRTYRAAHAMRFFASSIRATTLRQQTSNGLIRLWPGRDAHVEQFTGGVLRVRVALWPTACRFRTGHRLRLQDSSGADPRFSRTP